jgi:hypothetical protein
MPKIEKNEAIILILHSPRERIWGVLQEITAAGAFVRGVDLNAFEDYVQSIVRNEPFIGFCDAFFPLWRVEKILRDESFGGIPALFEQFEQRTGKKL